MSGYYCDFTKHCFHRYDRYLTTLSCTDYDCDFFSYLCYDYYQRVGMPDCQQISQADVLDIETYIGLNFEQYALQLF